VKSLFVGRRFAAGLASRVAPPFARGAGGVALLAGQTQKQYMRCARITVPKARSQRPGHAQERAGQAPRLNTHSAFRTPHSPTFIFESICQTVKPNPHIPRGFLIHIFQKQYFLPENARAVHYAAQKAILGV
jgi:hypothetical protein